MDRKATQNRNPGVASILLALVMAAMPLSAAADRLFLMMDEVRGEIRAPDGRFLIEIVSYAQSTTGPIGSGATSGAAGKAVCGPVSVTKYVDVASPDLLLYALNGEHVRQAVITFLRPGPRPVEYYKVTLNDVIVAAVSQGTSNGSDRATENVTLMARQFRYEYTQQDATGKLGARVNSGWDCVAGRKL